MAGMHKIIMAAVVGALFELDNYFIGMTLVSQPIIAGAVSGWIFGDIYTGILVGGIVQLIWINTPPVGAYVPPSASAIAINTTVIGVVALKFVQPANANPVLMFAMIGGAGTGYLVGQMDVWNRKLNTLIIHLFEEKVKEGKESYMVVIQFCTVLGKFIRDVLLYFAVFSLGVVLAVKIYVTLPEQVIFALRIAFWAMPAVGLAVVYDMFRTKSGDMLYFTLLAASYVVFSFFKVNPYFFVLAAVVAGGFVVYNTVWNRGE
jgi:PTS system N-acetylgalactosamine-specific IIC component